MIALFNDSYPPIMDGVALCVYNYAHYLNLQGTESVVVTLNAPGAQDNDDFKVLRIPSLPIPFRKPYRYSVSPLITSVTKELNTLPLELVHAHCPFTTGKLAKAIAKDRNIPLIGTFHSKYRIDFERYFHSKFIVDSIVKRIVDFFESCDEVWVPQTAVMSTLYDYGYKGKDPIVMPNGNDFVDRFDCDELRKKRREFLKISDATPLLLFVGQQTREKNLPFILHSLSQIKNDDYLFISIGEGYGLDEFRNLSEELGLQEKVHFIGPVFDRDELASYYAAADLFLFPSIYDNAPLVLREAAAMRTPGLLIEESTAAEVVKSGFNGFLSPNDVILYSEILQRIIHDKTTLSIVSQQAYQTLACGWQDIVVDVKKRYEEVIHSYKGRI